MTKMTELTELNDLIGLTKLTELTDNFFSALERTSLLFGWNYLNNKKNEMVTYLDIYLCSRVYYSQIFNNYNYII